MGHPSSRHVSVLGAVIDRPTWQRCWSPLTKKWTRLRTWLTAVADMREHHPHFLPPAFSDFRVESGGVGAGTITRFKMTAGERTREYRMMVAEPEPGRILTESDTNSSAVTTFTVSPQGGASILQSPPPGTARAGSAACSSACSRRGCCAPSMWTNSSDSMRTRANIAQHESRPPCPRQMSAFRGGLTMHISACHTTRSKLQRRMIWDRLGAKAQNMGTNRSSCRLRNRLIYAR